MTLRLDAEARAKLRELEAAKRAIQRPLKDAARQERKALQKARPKRERRVEHENAKPNRGREVDKTYRAWVRQLGCVAGLVRPRECSGATEAAHLRFSDAAAGRLNPGMGRKSDDSWVTPLCHHHHQCDQHKRSERAFWSDLGVDVNALCRDLREAYPDIEAAKAVLRTHARRITSLSVGSDS